jgi:cyanophycin synthetase
VLETAGIVPSAAMLDAWRARVGQLRGALGWPAGPIVARAHAGGASLAFSAPVDQWFSATEVNEWAWASVVLEHAPEAQFERLDALHAPGHAAAWDAASAWHTLRLHADGERDGRLAALVAAAHARGVTALIDDDVLSIGSGNGSMGWPRSMLPGVEAVDWKSAHDIPIALVTGSNGKTTTVRLLAAMARAHGWKTAHSCTDGLFLDGQALDAGDYSGPAGARKLLRHQEAQAAILETARGGILRRGIAPQRARCAIVTNISDDHFGEYGVHSLDDLAAVKLAVARVVAADGLLVLNADDALLVGHAPALDARLGWFARNDGNPVLVDHRAHGGATCGVQAGRLRLADAGEVHDLGEVEAMPLTFAGRATYNIANAAAAVLAAHALGIEPATIASVLARFGSERDDNPGRLQHWSIDGRTVLLDYAHNPDGLRGLLEVAHGAIEGQGRLVVLLGQAGNRGDAEVVELATVAAAARPMRIVLKDIEGMLRGRAPGEIPAILRTALERAGVAPGSIVECRDELEAAILAVMSATAGDVVVLPIHAARTRGALIDWLDAHAD